MFEKFEQKRQWSDNKGYSKLLIIKVNKQLITKFIITSFLVFGYYFLYEYIKYPNNKSIEMLNDAIVYIKIMFL